MGAGGFVSEGSSFSEEKEAKRLFPDWVRRSAVL
jgi:hypothetical protein